MCDLCLVVVVGEPVLREAVLLEGALDRVFAPLQLLVLVAPEEARVGRSTEIVPLPGWVWKPDLRETIRDIECRRQGVHYIDMYTTPPDREGLQRPRRGQRG